MGNGNHAQVTLDIPWLGDPNAKREGEREIQYATGFQGGYFVSGGLFFLVIVVSGEPNANTHYFYSMIIRGST